MTFVHGPRSGLWELVRAEFVQGALELEGLPASADYSLCPGAGLTPEDIAAVAEGGMPLRELPRRRCCGCRQLLLECECPF